MEQQESVGTEQPDERRGDERIHERLAVIEPLLVGIRPVRHMQERKGRVHACAHRPSQLEEHPRWAARELAPDAHEIGAAVLEIPISREAVGHHVVRRLVALKAERGPGKVHRQRQATVDEEDDRGGDEARTDIDDVRLCHGHGRPVRGAAGSGVTLTPARLRVRNDRSCARMPRRRVGRDTSWSKRVEPLHLPHERRDVEGPRRLSGVRPRAARARPGCSMAWTIPCASAAASRFGTIQAVRSGSRMSVSPSASVATIGRALASASNAVSGVPSQSDGNTLRSNADSVVATSFTKPTNTNRSPRPSRCACASSDGLQRSFAGEEEPGLRVLVNHQPRGLDQILVALRVVQPRDRADRKLARCECRAPDAPPRSLPAFAGG